MRGRLLPGWARAVKVPTSMKPKPSMSMPSTASPSLSMPAARPSRPGTGRTRGPPWLALGTGKAGRRPHTCLTTSRSSGTLLTTSMASTHTS